MAWKMTNAEKRYDKQATGVFKQKYGKKSKLRSKTKADRQAWWRSLTDEQRQAYIEKKQAEKANRPARGSNCPIYGPWDDTNRHIWREKVLRLNPWLDLETFEPQKLDINDQNLTGEDEILWSWPADANRCQQHLPPKVKEVSGRAGN